MKVSELKAVVGWITALGPVCLRCAKNALNVSKFHVEEGMGSGIPCIYCKHKLSKVYAAHKYSLLLAWAKSDESNTLPEPDDFYERLKKR